MRMLAIETATEACSIALFEDGGLVEARHEVLGRGHAERLVPMIAKLADRGRADTIRVSLGPGSFTGVRIGLATARALGIAWQAEVTGYPTLALVAAMALRERPEAVTVCMNGGHGQWFVQDFDARGCPVDDARSLDPQTAAHNPTSAIVAGNRAEEYARMGGGNVRSMPLLPDARAILAVPASLCTTDLSPIYGRPPDARVTPP